jgi:hypothetical protein
MCGKYFFHFAAATILLQTALRAQTQWQEYSGNPVVTAGVYYAMDPAVVYDATAGQYRMWYRLLKLIKPPKPACNPPPNLY